MTHIGFRGFHEVGNEVVTPLQLYFYLGKAVFMPILQAHQVVVDGHNPKRDRCQDNQNNDEFHSPLHANESRSMVVLSLVNCKPVLNERLPQMGNHCKHH